MNCDEPLNQSERFSIRLQLSLCGMHDVSRFETVFQKISGHFDFIALVSKFRGNILLIDNYHNFIKNEYEARKKNNPNFSLRAYARWLGISPAQVSQLISGKRKLSKKMAIQIADRFGLSPREKIELLEALTPELIEEKEELRSEKTKTLLQEDKFSLIADWPHYSILSLSETSKAKADPRWIAQRLGIDVTTARESFERLVRLGIIEMKGKSYQQSEKPLTTSKDIASRAIQRHHKQNLNLAQQKLECVSLKAREFSSITMAVNPQKIKQAKILINEFKRKLCSLLEEGDKKEVYTLSIQLFPNSILKEEPKQ